jgi:RNA polymerase sigma factor (sigma-70 family)
VANGQLNLFLGHLRRIVQKGTSGGLSDRDLVARYLRDGDEAAFEALVWRHGPMVLSLCQRVLRNSHDAEDAFQATFLTLARKAGSIAHADAVGSWLYKVAWRVAVRARAHPAPAAIPSEILQEDSQPDPATVAAWNEVRPILDEAIQRLPERYRSAIVLYYLEGKPNRVVAGELGCPVGTVTSRLSRGRELLRRELARRGTAVTTVLLGAVLAQAAQAGAACCAGPLVLKTFLLLKPVASQAVLAIPARILFLSKGVIHTMWLGKMKTFVAAAVTLIGLVFLCFAHTEGDPQPRPKTASARPRQAPATPKAILPITSKTQKAIDAGLAYLAKNQADDGSWGTGNYQGNLAMTGLAGLAFLAQGAKPGQGKYGPVLNKALDFILAHEDPGQPGYFHTPQSPVHGPMYCHAFAVEFLAEARPTIADADKKAAVGKALKRAVKLMLDSQNHQGGWRYQPRPRDADVSVTACQMLALLTAKKTGIEVPPEAVDGGLAYIKSCQVAENGSFLYMPGQGPPGFPRSAAAVAVLVTAGKDAAKEDAAKKGLDYLFAFKPGNDQKKEESLPLHYYYGHYFAAQAMWKAGGKFRTDWYPAIRDELLRPAGEGGALDNGWWADPRLSPHYATAVALIILQIPKTRLASWE